MRRTIITTAVATALLTIGGEAGAVGPVSIEAAATIGGGTNPFYTEPNALGLGIGGRAGASFLGVYAGLRALYYVGGTKPAMLGSPAQVERHSWLYGVELGYGIRAFDVLTIRPQLGIGSYALSNNIGTQLGTNNLYLEPALVALVTFRPFVVGVDAGALLLPTVFSVSATPPPTYAAFTAHAQVGVTF